MNQVTAMVLGYILCGYACYKMTNGLAEMYPFGSKKFWVKYLPVFGYSFLMIGAVHKLMFVLGTVIFLSGFYFLFSKPEETSN